MRLGRLIIVAAILFIAVLALVRPWTEWIWFSNLGYGVVFANILLARLKLVAVFGGGFLLIVGLNLRLAWRIAPPPQSHYEFDEGLAEKLGYAARFGIAAMFLIALLVVTFFVSTDAWTRWDDYLKFANATAFGKTEPVFNKDIGFYIFRLPFVLYVYRWLMFALAASLVGVAVFHYMNRAIEFFADIPRFAPGVKSHLSILLALILALKAFGYRLQAYGLMNTEGNLFTGPAYTDIHARIPAFWILSVTALVSAIIVLYGIRRLGLKAPIFAVSLLVAVSLLAGGIFPPSLQALSVKANQAAKEKPYISRAIAATTEAYGLSSMQRKLFPAKSTLTPQDIANNRPTLQNVRLWDYEPIQNVYSQLQEIQQYYRFPDVDIDRYMVNGTPRQVMIAGREMSHNDLPTSAQTWVNLHLQYTHGYGLCASPVNVVTEEGLPAFFVRDIPPVSVHPVLAVSRPQIYFGEETNDYVLVRTTEKEFDYPSGDENVFTTYQEDAGIPIGSFGSRLLWSVRLGDPYILLNRNTTRESRLLFRRNIVERIKTLFPFLVLDSDPYIVLVDGKIYWIQDAYTITDKYPYSATNGRRLNYIRNSVKLTVDAYTGEVKAYIFDKRDPIIQTWRKAFPGIWLEMEQMPESLRAHVRYPEGIFQIQAETLLYYHMRNPIVFYNKGDVWAFPQVERKTDEIPRPMEPYYMVMKLPGEKKEEFILLFPFRRGGEKKNMVAWMCARCDPEHYGELVLYEFPKGQLIYGPSQIAGRINQNPDISREISLWDAAGSRVTWGNLLVIPIEQSLLYVRPLYLESTITKIPEFRRAVVALGEDLVWAPSFEEALGRVVGMAAPNISGFPAPTAPQKVRQENGLPTIRDLVNEAKARFEAGQQALKQGNWAAYGQEQKALQDALNRLFEATK